VADFSAPCQAARNALQAAVNAYLSARRTTSVAEFTRDRAVRDVDAARAIARNAEAARVVAAAAWQALVDRLTADPTFATGIADARFVNPPAVAGLAGGELVGPLPLPDGTNRVLFGRDELPSILAAWRTAATNALAEDLRLKRAAEATAVDAAARAADLANAERLLADAERALTDARAAQDGVRTRAIDADRTVQATCSGEARKDTIDGTDFEVRPGVLPEDEETLRRLIGRIAGKEKTGLTSIELEDLEGAETSYVDPNTGATIAGRRSGQYSRAGRSIIVYDQDEQVLKHEIGHHVYYQRLPADVRDEWERYWGTGNNKLKTPLGKMPTGYAGSEADEAFADVYEFFYDMPGALDPETRDKIADLLRRIP
jgi:hypothetical protein